MPNKETAYKELSGPAYRGEFVERYDNLRPEPPPELIAILLQLAPGQPARLVVDLGCGTGISTVAWSDHAEHVIGIDENPEMLAAARRAPNVEYREAEADATGLPDACADIVTCAQSFHWMPRRRTLIETARILQPDGLFAAYDYDWPPVVDSQVDHAFLYLIAASGVDPSRPEKAEHLRAIAEVGLFHAEREFFVHGRQLLDSARLIALPTAFGPIARRLDDGRPLPRFDAFRDLVQRRIGARQVPVWWSYRVRAAFKP